jgi:hypothetical protein
MTPVTCSIVEEGHSKIFTLQSPVAGATLRRSKIERVKA